MGNVKEKWITTHVRTPDVTLHTSFFGDVRTLGRVTLRREPGAEGTFTVYSVGDSCGDASPCSIFLAHA